MYLHGVEEILTGFYSHDPIVEYFSSRFHSIPQAVYYSSHSVWWVLLGLVALLTSGERRELIVMTLFGLVYIFELHHLIEAFRTMSYYPGVITTFLFQIVGFFYWKELIRSWTKSS